MWYSGSINVELRFRCGSHARGDGKVGCLGRKVKQRWLERGQQLRQLLWCGEATWDGPGTGAGNTQSTETAVFRQSRGRRSCPLSRSSAATTSYATAIEAMICPHPRLCM